MKKITLLIFINLTLVLFQSSVFSVLFGNINNPNLVLAFAFAFYFIDLDDVGILSAFIGGILLDLFGFSIVGVTPIILIGSLLFFIYVKRYLFRGFVSNVLSVLIAQSVYLLFLSGVPLQFDQYLFSGLITLLACLLFYWVFKKLSSYLPTSGYKFTR